MSGSSRMGGVCGAGGEAIVSTLNCSPFRSTTSTSGPLVCKGLMNFLSRDARSSRLGLNTYMRVMRDLGRSRGVGAMVGTLRGAPRSVVGGSTAVGTLRTAGGSVVGAALSLTHSGKVDVGRDGRGAGNTGA